MTSVVFVLTGKLAELCPWLCTASGAMRRASLTLFCLHEVAGMILLLLEGVVIKNDKILVWSAEYRVCAFGV